MNEFNTYVDFYVYLYTKQHGSKTGEKHTLMRFQMQCVCVMQCGVQLDKKVDFPEENIDMYE